MFESKTYAKTGRYATECGAIKRIPNRSKNLKMAAQLTGGLVVASSNLVAPTK